jgi:transcription antitermination factor NusG
MSYWAVARTVVLCEQLVCRRLERIGFETYFPRVEVERRSARNRLYKRAEPLFHAYIFVRLILQWHEVRRTPDVTQIVMQGDMPAQLDDAIVDELKGRAGPDGLIHLPRRAGLTFRCGDRIRVRSGPLIFTVLHQTKPCYPVLSGANPGANFLHEKRCIAMCMLRRFRSSRQGRPVHSGTAASIG